MNRISPLRSIRLPIRLPYVRGLAACALAVFDSGASASSPTPYPLMFAAGSPAEQSFLIKNAGSTVTDAIRHGEKGQFWVYGLPVSPGARCRLTLTLDRVAATVPPAVTILGQDNKPLGFRIERDADGGFVIVWTVPEKWPVGQRFAVMLSAKDGPVGVKSAQLAQTLPDSNGDGLPDAIQRLIVEGMPAGARPTVTRQPAQSFTVTMSSQPVSPTLDVQTDAVFADVTESAAIGAWKARGYAVWTPGNSRAGKDFIAKSPEDAQIGRDGKPLFSGGRALLGLTPNVLNADRSLFDMALMNGSEGVCFQEPEYAASAGYEPAFKQTWQTQFNVAWQDPLASPTARYRAGLLMTNSVIGRVQSVLQFASQRKPAARRMVMLHSPLYAAQMELVSPAARLAGLNEVTDIVADVGVDTAALPARYAGLRQEMLFARSYLEYSALLHAGQGLNKRVWFLTDPLADVGQAALPNARSRYEQTLAAALLFPEVTAYHIVLPPDSLTSSLPPEDAARLHSVLAALEDMHNQTAISGNADKNDDIGVLVSDTSQWQRGGPNASDPDGLFGLTLPLLQRGVPVQVLSLDRVADPGYLNGYRTLLVSFDFQKPLGARTQQALAEWVRRGGSLLFFGGTDAYNNVTDSWWQQAGYQAPQQDLWKQLGIEIGVPTARSAPSEDTGRYQTVLKAQPAARNGSNRRAYAMDLTPFAQPNGSVAVRVSCPLAASDGAASVASGELTIGGKVAASFAAGSEIENRFLVYDNASRFDGKNRIADGSASWTYQFDNLPRNTPITLTLDMANDFIVSAANARPDFGHTLLSTGTNGMLSKSFPRLRIGASYPATLYALPAPGSDNASSIPLDTHARPVGSSGRPNDRTVQKTSERSSEQTTLNNMAAQPSVLYTLRAGGAAVWFQNVGRGLALNVGVAPGFFSSSERGASLLRALTRFAHQRAGGNYQEPGVLRLRRGRYTIIRTFAESATVEGRMIDVLSPTLNIADDRIIPPNSSAILYDLGVPEAEPHLGFVSGRVQAKAETPTATAFYTRGAAGTTGVARLHRGNRRLVGARGTDWMGRPVPVQAQEEGGTVLLRYANDPDGVIIHAGWQ